MQVDAVLSPMVPLLRAVFEKYLRGEQRGPDVRPRLCIARTLFKRLLNSKDPFETPVEL